MKVKPTGLTITINEHEAKQVINALNKGLKDEFISTESDMPAAHHLLELLQANFESSVTGVHVPK